MKRGILLLLLVTLAVSGCAAPAPSGPPPAFETGVDAESWVLVPAGEFLLSRHAHETLIDYDFEIMTTPVTNAQYVRYANEALAAGKIEIAGEELVGPYPGDAFHGERHEEEIDAGNWPLLTLNHTDSRLTFDGQTFSVKPGYESHPVTMVTWFGARAYCEYYGWRLPTETEWEKAARGTDGRAFPWGNEIVVENANYHHSKDPFEPIGTTPVGFYNGAAYAGFQTVDSPSPYGAYDMAGNVWQWTGDVYEGTHYRFMRGGSLLNYGYDLRVWTRNSARPDFSAPSTGFRALRTVAG